MRVFVDTNVLLDVLQQREPHVNASSIVWKACECGEIEGAVSALTFPNIVYILRKDMTPARVRDVLAEMSLIFSFIDFTVQDMKLSCRDGVGRLRRRDPARSSGAGRSGIHRYSQYSRLCKIGNAQRADTLVVEACWLAALAPQELLLKLKEQD